MLGYFRVFGWLRQAVCVKLALSMRILIVNEKISPEGGAEQYIFDAASGLEKRGHQVLLKTDQEDVTLFVKKEKPAVVYLQNVFRNDLYKELPKLVPTIHYVHDHRTYSPGPARVHFQKNEICVAPLSLFHSLIYAYSQKCMSRNPFKIFNLVFSRKELLRLHNNLKKVLANSQFVKKLLVLNGVKESLIEVLPPAVLMQKTAEKMETEKPVILFAGRLFIEKGAEYLIRAMKSIEGAQAWILGNGWDEERLKNLTKELNLEDRIRFFGWVKPEEIGRYYQASSIGVVPSIWPEPFGLSGISFMSHSKPVVAFDVGGIRDWLEDGKTGFLVKRADINGLAQKINLLLNDSKLTSEMGEKARHLFEQKFTIQKHLDRLEKIFQEALV